MTQESSAKLTNQRVSYAFTSSPFSFHARHILPYSKFQHSYCCILLIFFIQTSVTAWQLWVWIQFTGLVTPMNNPIALITSTVAGLHFCCCWQYSIVYCWGGQLTVCVAVQISEQYSPKARTPTHWMPSSDQILIQNVHSRSFKVIRFGVNKEPLRSYVVQYNNCGLECEGSEDIASEKKRKSPFSTTPLSLSSEPSRISAQNLHC